MRTAIVGPGQAKISMTGLVTFVDEIGLPCCVFDLASMGEFNVLIEHQSMMVDDNTQVCIKFSACIPTTNLVCEPET